MPFLSQNTLKEQLQVVYDMKQSFLASFNDSLLLNIYFLTLLLVLSQST